MVSRRSLPLSFAGSLRFPPGAGELQSLLFRTAPLQLKDFDVQSLNWDEREAEPEAAAPARRIV